MRDRRVMVFKKSLEELVESLDATVRIARWEGLDEVPQPLRDSASKLVTRLGTTDRLAQGVFKGNAADVTNVNRMTDAMKRLETAYVTYRKKLDSPVVADGTLAREELVRTIEQVRAETLGG